MVRRLLATIPIRVKAFLTGRRASVDEVEPLLSVRKYDEGRVAPHDPPEAGYYTIDASPADSDLSTSFIRDAYGAAEHRAPGDAEITKLSALDDGFDPGNMNGDVVRAEWVDLAGGRRGQIDFNRDGGIRVSEALMDYRDGSLRTFDDRL